MLPISTNILDQLLGGFETQPSGPTGSSSGTGESGLPFGDLLGQMLGSTTRLDKILPQNIQGLFPPNDRPVAQDGAPAGPTVDVSLLAVPLAIDPSWSLISEADATGTTPQESKLVDNCLLFADLPASSLDLEQLTSINGKGLTGQAVYDVLDAQINGGQLELSLLAKGGSGDPITVSLPLSAFEQAVLKNSSNFETISKLQSFAGTAQGNQSAGLDKLLHDLNLKSLEIREATAPVSGESMAAPLELTLLGEDQGARIVLTARINKHDLFVKPSGEATGNQASFTSDGSLLVESDTSGETSSDDQSDNLHMLLRKPLSSNARMLMQNKLVEAKPFSLDALTSVDGSDKLAPKTATTQNAVTSTSVRLTLPETITRPFFSTGQTIMIKIEPEHLGPARLNLALHNQMLTARVTVDTQTARMAVESSLQQLTDQLAKVGIQVDRIDVVLSDGGTSHQFQDHRSMWSQARRLRHVKDEEELNANNLSAPLNMMPPRQYLGTQGVNLLA